jgi:hypothetical protein
MYMGGDRMPKASSNAYSSYSPELYDVVREALYRIGDIDCQHQSELCEVDRALSDEELKSYIKQRILAAHQKQRQPYVDLLATLRSDQQC